MTAAERRAILCDFKKLYSELRDEIKAEIRIQVRAVSHEICDVLIGQGVLEPEEKLLTKAQVMKMYGVSKTKLEDMMKTGILEFIKLGDSKQSPVRIRPADARIAFETGR